MQRALVRAYECGVALPRRGGASGSAVDMLEAALRALDAGLGFHCLPPASVTRTVAEINRGERAQPNPNEQ